MVFGAVQRQGKVKIQVIPQTTIENVEKVISEFIEPNSTMVTDEHQAYNNVGKNYKHETIKHYVIKSM